MKGAKESENERGKRGEIIPLIRGEKRGGWERMEAGRTSS